VDYLYDIKYKLSH